MLHKPCWKRLQCGILVYNTGFFLLPSRKQSDRRRYMGSMAMAHSATLWASPERPLASCLFQGATGRIARHGVRRVKSAESFPCVFLCFQNAAVLTKTISSVFLRSPPFSSVFLCSFYTACATFSLPTLDGLVGQTICPEPALWAKDQGVLDPALCFVAVDGFGWSKSTGDVADKSLGRALGWHSFLHGEMSRHGITADVVRANGLDGSG